MRTRLPLATLHLGLAAAIGLSLVACGDPRDLVVGQAPDGGQQQCTTCHGAPPAKDAHLAHGIDLAGSVAPGALPRAPIACLQCHTNVQDPNQPGHIFDENGKPLPPPAVVRFDDPGAIAGKTQPGASRAGAPFYDSATRTCSNVYCHGNGLQAATSDVVLTPAWNAPAGSIGCGRCHGIPPADHQPGLAITDCSRCHGAAIDASGILNAKHVNGTVDVTPGVESSCATCHGSGAPDVLPGDPRSAPPRDANGATSSAAVGAHQAHVVGGRLGLAVACSECHVVPATLLAPGHVDGSVTVRFGPLATKGGTQAAYAGGAARTCSNVYCHGSFPFSKVTLPPPAPVWTAGTAAVACGSCHDLPPPAPGHRPVNVATQGCGTTDFPGLACHPAPYSPTSVDPKLHIDGKVCPPFCTPGAP